MGLLGASAQDIDLESAERAFIVKVGRHRLLTSLVRVTLACIGLYQLNTGHTEDGGYFLRFEIHRMPLSRHGQMGVVISRLQFMVKDQKGVVTGVPPVT